MSEPPPEMAELVRILAAVDVLFGPWPDPRTNNPACVEMHTRQQQYLAGRGIPWRIGGGAGERKAGERLLADLESEGFVTLSKAVGSHRQLGLTPKGDDVARGLLDFFRVSDSWNLFRGLAQAVQAGPGRWVSPRQVAAGLGVDNEQPAWAMLLPLLARGLIESAVDTRARTVFTVRPEKSHLAAGSAPELLADPEPDGRLAPIYWASFDVAEAEKAGWKPRRENAVLIPILN